MSHHAIEIRGLSKRYRLGATASLDQSFREMVYERLGRCVRRGRGGAPSQTDDREFWALRDVSFDVARGEVIGVIGRNGAGKSTLLKILSRITDPTEGEARIRGRVASLLEVGSGFHPELTGRENIYLNGAILGMTSAEVSRKFDEIVDFAGIERFLDTPVKRYSSGMYVRLAFAVAAHLEPEILIVDEVLAVGDAAFQAKCLGKMSEVAAGGRTVLFVSHTISALRQFCPRGILLEQGRATFDGDMTACLDRYLGADMERGRTIIDHAQYNDPTIHLARVAINGSHEDTLRLSDNDDVIRVEIDGELRRSARLLIEARVSDSQHRCLALFTPRYSESNFPALGPGPFVLRDAFRLPRLNSGVYHLSLFVADADHRGLSPVKLDYCVRLNAEGAVGVTGWTYKFDHGNGWMLLERLPPTGSLPLRMTA